MRSSFAIPALLLAMVLFGPSSASGEEVFVLKDGTEHIGKLTIESPDKLVLLTPDGKVTILRTQLKERRPGPSAVQIFEDRAGITAAKDHGAWRKLARWARNRGLEAQRDFAYKKVLDAKPGDAEAKKVLGTDAPNAKPNPAAIARSQLRARLEQVDVDFDFRRESIETIMTAVSKASDVGITIDKAARKDLRKRGVKLRYKAKTKAMTVIQGIAKSAKLDFELTADGVVIGTPRSIRKLRKKLGLKRSRKSKPRVSPEEARELLASSKHTIRSINRPLKIVLDHLKASTPLPYLYAGPAKTLEKTVLFDVYLKPLGELLDRILKPLGLDYMLQGNTVYIASAAQIKELKEPLDKGK